MFSAECGVGLAFLALLGGCAHMPAATSSGSAAPVAQPMPAPVGQAAAIAAPRRDQIVPLVDHHQHLMSPAGAEQVNKWLPRTVELPAEVALLLRQRSELWNKPVALAELYAPDSFILPTNDRKWLSGHRQVAEYITKRFGSPYRLTPTQYTSAGNTAAIAGFYSRGEGEAVRHVGYFGLTLSREPRRGWRIVHETMRFPGPAPLEQQLNAQGLIELLDAAGIRGAVVLSDAYYFDGAADLAQPDTYAKVRAENDWTAAQVAQYPDRLVALCSFNPIADHALDEVRRCASSGRFVGFKLHFASTGVNISSPDHREKVRRVFAAANEVNLPILAHVASDGYGKEHAELIVHELLPAAPHIQVVIAHLWGGGAVSEAALAVYADAISEGRPFTRNLYFELAQASTATSQQPSIFNELVRRMRQIGLDRMLYGSDGPQFGGLPPKQVWEHFRDHMPLTDEELGLIAHNVAPFLRRQENRFSRRVPPPAAQASDEKNTCLF
jgi:uncharacterized protein